MALADILKNALTGIALAGMVACGPRFTKNGSRGIDYLISNPPTMTDLRQLPTYQARALQELATPSP